MAFGKGKLSMKKTGIGPFVETMRKHARRLQLQSLDPDNVKAGVDASTAAMLIERWGAAHVQIMNLIQEVNEETNPVEFAKQVASLLGARVDETKVDPA